MSAKVPPLTLVDVLRYRAILAALPLTQAVKPQPERDRERR